jgi:hypothetical protein
MTFEIYIWSSIVIHVITYIQSMDMGNILDVGMHNNPCPTVHAKLGYYACQIGMHNKTGDWNANFECKSSHVGIYNNPWDVVHAKLDSEE